MNHNQLSIIDSIIIIRVLEELLGPLGLAVNQDMEEGKLGKVIIIVIGVCIRICISIRICI